jgi:hypothetical protein
MYGSPYGYPGIGYGNAMPGYGYGFPAYGPAYGDGYGYPGVTDGYGYPAGLGFASPLFADPYANPLFGLGLSPLGVQSYFTEANSMGRAQIEADRRARARDFRRRGR